MPGRVFLTDTPETIGTALGQAWASVGDEPPRHNIAPGQEVLAATSAGLSRMRWGMIPVGRVNARGRPVMETIVNARSETVFEKTAFAGVGRAILPVNGWYEWTGTARRKTAWRIAPKDAGLLFFAAITDIWTAPGGRQVPQLATITCEPSADVQGIHHRMAVILTAADVARWLHEPPETASDLMRPWPDGQLVVTPAEDVDWTAP